MRVILAPIGILGILIIALLICSGCTQTGTPSISSPQIATDESKAGTKETMISFVKEAVVYANANGKEKALTEFSNPRGSFFRGDLSIYAYDYNGTAIALPLNPEKIGVNRLEEKDADGNFFIRELMDATTDDTNFVTYYSFNASQNNLVDTKLGYAMRVDDEWWLGSGIYLGPANTAVSEPVVTPTEEIVVSNKTK
jgi:signal transduction histidine kinase